MLQGKYAYMYLLKKLQCKPCRKQCQKYSCTLGYFKEKQHVSMGLKFRAASSKKND